MYDACIIGSGAGGGTMAYALAKAGLKVVVLEKGPWYREKDFVHDEIATVRRDFFVPSIHEEPHMLDGKRSSMGWIACCVGGGTVHMAGYFYRLHADDFRMASRFGTPKELSLADWPYAYEDLERYYTKVEQEIGVSGLAGSNPFEGKRSKPYPLPPVKTHPLAEWIDKAGKKLGMHPFPSPRAIISAPFKGRKACAYCDFCGSYGCEVGAKSSTLAALLPAAVKTGRCEIRAKCMVRRIESADGRVTGCVTIDEHGVEKRVRARMVIVSCSAIESARLLLISGLANASGLVGKNLQFSSFSSGSATYAIDKSPLLRARDPFLGRSMQDFYFLPKGVADLPKGGTIRFGFPHANPIFTALKLAHEKEPLRWGMSLKDRMRNYWKETRTVEFEVFADFLPNPRTYIDLDPTVKDRWGLPVARIHIGHPKHHKTAGKFLVDKGLELLAATGADALHRGDLASTTGHLLHGTCRAGKDPEQSVLDPDCRSHELPNLYVVDGSFMPTSGGVPTTLTIMANAFRVADKILER